MAPQIGGQSVRIKGTCRQLGHGGAGAEFIAGTGGHQGLQTFTKLQSAHYSQFGNELAVTNLPWNAPYDA
ncbi:MAG: hypothetical protein Kow0096_16020 [Thiohalomonadaceae bacterium]